MGFGVWNLEFNNLGFADLRSWELATKVERCWTPTHKLTSAATLVWSASDYGYIVMSAGFGPVQS